MKTITRVVRVPQTLTGIPYNVYVSIRDAPGNDKLRMNYHDGVLEFMAPAEFRHERGSHTLGMIVLAYSCVFDLPCEGARSTTFRRGLPGELKGAGKEPDQSYYFADNAEYVREKETLDLERDPPPDLWIEVDNNVSSKGRLPLYAELGIPEVWRYQIRRRSLWFGSLKNGEYVEIDRSLCLPKLTPDIVLDLVDEARKRGQTAWFRWMRNWMDTTLRNAND